MAAMSTGKKLAIAGLVVAGATAYMAYLGASSSWQYYMTVKECAGKRAPGRRPANPRQRHDRARLAGDRARPAGGPLLAQRGRQPNPRRLPGPLPDDLSPAKTMEVVVEGRLEGVLASSTARQADHPLRQQVQRPEERIDGNCRPAGRGDRAMTSLGQLCLLIAMICSGYAAFAAIVGCAEREPRPGPQRRRGGVHGGRGPHGRGRRAGPCPGDQRLPLRICDGILRPPAAVALQPVGAVGRAGRIAAWSGAGSWRCWRSFSASHPAADRASCANWPSARR